VTRLTGIYALADPRTGVVRYVGKAVNITARYRQHCKGGDQNPGPWVAWLWQVTRRRPLLIVLQLCARGDLADRERWWIAEHRRAGGLLNQTDGGEGTLGLKHTPETCAKRNAAIRKQHQDPAVRAKISDATRRRYQDPAERAKTADAVRRRFEDPAERAKSADAARGRVKSPETRAKLRAAMLRRYRDNPAERTRLSVANRGKKLSPEHRAKLRAAQLGKHHTAATWAKLRAAALRQHAQERLKRAAGPLTAPIVPTRPDPAPGPVHHLT